MRRDGDCQLTLLLCFSLDISWQLCLCCGPESAFFAPQQAVQVSHTERLTSAHFLSITECCEGKHKNRFVFCLHNDFIWRIQQMQFWLPKLSGHLTRAHYTSLLFTYMSFGGCGYRNISSCETSHGLQNQIIPCLIPDLSQYSRPQLVTTRSRRVTIIV